MRTLRRAPRRRGRQEALAGSTSRHGYAGGTDYKRRAGARRPFAVGSKSRRNRRGATPAAPFTTSTLQQEASRKLGLRAFARTMQLAQRLYEGIDDRRRNRWSSSPTCERTASTWRRRRLTADTPRDRRRNTASEYVPERAAQIHGEGEERAGGARGRAPDRPRRVCRSRSRAHSRCGDQARLYELIWTRTIASQMESAELERTTVDIVAKAAAIARLICGRPAKSMRFDGFLKLYQEGRDDRTPGSSDEEDDGRLPAMKVGDATLLAQGSHRSRDSISPSRRRASRKRPW